MNPSFIYHRNRLLKKQKSSLLKKGCMKANAVFREWLAGMLVVCSSCLWEQASAKQIIAHYMPWYQSKPISGFWGWHWHMNHFSPPDTLASHYRPWLGPYDSKDPHLLATQALLLKFAGIDGVIIDWYGIVDFWDYGRIRDATNALIPFLKKANRTFSICYEDQTIKNMLNNGYFPDRQAAVAHGVEVMQWLQTNYFSDPAYLKIDGRPVLLCFGPQFFTASEWTTLFAGLNPKPHFFPLQYHVLPESVRTGEFGWPEPAYGTSGVIPRLDAFYSRAASSGWNTFIPAAFPRFHDIYQEAGVGPSYGYIDAQGNYGTYGTSTYSYTLERALQSQAEILQIVTWNDYGEGTIIEPTQEDGYQFLEITQTLRKQYLDPDLPYRPSDLRLPVRLYTLRQAYRTNPVKLNQLNLVEDCLFSDQLTEAEQLMNQIDCDIVIPGDVNSDCRVNLLDFSLQTSAWLSTPGQAHWNPIFDISNPADERIDLGDLLVIAEHWLSTDW